MNCTVVAIQVELSHISQGRVAYLPTAAAVRHQTIDLTNAAIYTPKRESL